LVYFDLDHFKQVNDTYGHSAGDHVLKECAQLVKTLVRREDVFGRLGGEEFAVVLPNSRLDEATELGERIRASIEGHGFRLEVDSRSGRRGMDHRQTVSVGVAELGEAMTDPRELLDAADRALYRAKHGGRNRVSV
ncbi:MAG: GGDEF domain-containing protein, partial [Aquabacterium sp.]|nr:GGDEF domain-containing protein [Aquabacterium sp.]